MTLPPDIDDEVRERVNAIDAILATAPVDLPQLKTSIIRLLEYLCSAQGRTDRNVQTVDFHFLLHVSWRSVDLPSEFNALLWDIGGCLHDAVSHPKIAENFESMPEQLLARAKALHTTRDRT